MSQNLYALGWTRSPRFLLQEPDLPDDIAAVVWGSDQPASLKQKGCHTGLVHLPGHSPQAPEPTVRPSAASALCCGWECAGFLWEFCQKLVLDPHSLGLSLVGRSGLTGR